MTKEKSESDYRAILCPDEIWLTVREMYPAINMSKLTRILMKALIDGKIEVTVEGEVIAK